MRPSVEDRMRKAGLDPNGPCPLCGKTREEPGWTAFRRGFVCGCCRVGHDLRRVSAFVLDVVAVITLYGTALAVAGGRSAMLETLLFWSSVAAFLGKDGFRGRSPGKFVTGLRVVSIDALQPSSVRQSTMRNLVFFLPCGIGILIAALTTDSMTRFGEKWARTMVIEDRYRYNPIFTSDTRCCRVCTYDLTGNVSGVCPECGTAIVSPSALSPR